MARQHDRITIPAIWVAVALSLILHAMLLWGWLPNLRMLPFEDSKLGKPEGALAVRLAPPVAPASPAQLAVARGSATPRTVQRATSAPPVLALERQSPSAAIAPPPAESARPPASSDFAAFVEARRRARDPAPAPPPQAESDQERNDRIAAERLGLNRTPGIGAERKLGGGIFQIERMGNNDAEFFFFGWNKIVRKNARQMISVRRGDDATMEIAVVRRMIAIIREQVSGDFVWDSRRLGRDVPLSARAADNAALEDFMMREFFPDSRPRP